MDMYCVLNSDLLCKIAELTRNIKWQLSYAKPRNQKHQINTLVREWFNQVEELGLVPKRNYVVVFMLKEGNYYWKFPCMKLYPYTDSI